MSNLSPIEALQRILKECELGVVHTTGEYIRAIATEALAYKGQEEKMPVLNPDKKLLPFVPMNILNEEWAQKNHGQSLARLKERQGLSLSEIVAITEKRKWHEISQLQCLSIIATKLLPSYKAGEDLEPVQPTDICGKCGATYDDILGVGCCGKCFNDPKNYLL